jgi:excinuclease ABC subunit B
MSDLENILKLIESEIEVAAGEFEKENKLVEAQRLRKRVGYDIRMIKETGFVNGIENYSLYFDGREPGQPPFTIFDYFPDDMLMIIDESHMSLPQLRAMPQADKARKENLVKHGFRLPSARDHRPLSFEELEVKLGWKKAEKDSVLERYIPSKPDAQTLFVSATPGPYEIQLSDHVVQQLIRPT